MIDLYGQQEVNESLALLRVEQFIVDNATVNQMVGGGDDLAENEDYVAGDDAAYDTEIDADTMEDYVEEDLESEMVPEDTVEEEMVVEG